MRPPEYITWLHEGHEITQLTATYKRELLIDYAERFSLRTFVETGTCGGDTIAHLLPHFDVLWSIELDPKRFQRGVERFAGNPKVNLRLGDSAEVLPQILPAIDGPALYWLDAHLEGPPTGLGPNNPLMAELGAIISQHKQGVVLIDDMDFGKRRELSDGVLRIEL